MKKHWAEVVLATCGVAAVAVLLSLWIPLTRARAAACGSANLMEDSSTDDPAREERIRQIILNHGPKAVPRVLSELRPGEFSGATISALSSLGCAVVPELLTAFNDPRPEVRLIALRTLTCLAPQLGSESSQLMSGLIKLLADSDPEIRFAAVLVIGRMGTIRVQAVPALLAILREDGADVDEDSLYLQQYAIHILGRIGTPARQAVPQLIASLNHADGGTQKRAAIALWQITRNADLVVPALLGMVREGDRGTRQFASLMLRRISPETLETNRTSRLDEAQCRPVIRPHHPDHF